jgi:hypothetical protein
MPTKIRTLLPERTIRPMGTTQTIHLLTTDAESSYRFSSEFAVLTIDDMTVVERYVSKATSAAAGAEAVMKLVQENLKCGREYGPSISKRLKGEGFSVIEVAHFSTKVG